MCILDTTTAATITSPKAISSARGLLVCGQIFFNMTFMHASLQGAVTRFYRCAFEIKRFNLKCNECCPTQESWRQMIDLKKKEKKDDRYYIRCRYSDASIIHCGESRAILTVKPHAHFLMACQSQFSGERSEHTPDTQYDQDLMFLGVFCSVWLKLSLERSAVIRKVSDGLFSIDFYRTQSTFSTPRWPLKTMQVLGTPKLI